VHKLRSLCPPHVTSSYGYSEHITHRRIACLLFPFRFPIFSFTCSCASAIVSWTSSSQLARFRLQCSAVPHVKLFIAAPLCPLTFVSFSVLQRRFSSFAAPLRPPASSASLPLAAAGGGGGGVKDGVVRFLVHC